MDRKREQATGLSIEQLPGNYCILRFAEGQVEVAAVNRRCAETFGLTEGNAAFPTLNERERSRLFSHFTPCACAQHEKVTVRRRAALADGRSCWVRLDAVWLSEEEGAGFYLCGLADVTEELLRERQAAEVAAELEEVRAELRGTYGARQGDDRPQMEQRPVKELIERATSCGILVRKADTSLKTLYVSKNIPVILGYTQEEFAALLDAGFQNVLHPEDGKRLLAYRETAKLPLAEYATEYRVRKKNGDYLWVYDTTRRDEYYDGTPIYFSLLVDVSKGKQTEEQLRREQILFQTVAAHSGRMVVKYDSATHTLVLGEEVAGRFGVEPVITGSAEHTLWLEGVAKESREEYLRFFRAIDRGDSSGTALIRRKDGAGVYAWYQFDFTTISSQDQPHYTVISFGDVTDRHEMELAYRESRQKFDGMDSRSYTYYTFNLARNFCSTEKGALLEHVLEHSDGTMEGMVQYACETYLVPESEAEFRKFNNRTRLMQDYERGVGEAQREFRIYHGDAERWIQECVRMFEDPYSGDVQCVFSYTDIDEEKRKLLSLLKRAEFDALTNLLNREAFSERVEQILARGDKSHALLLLDLDQFKAFNDSFGHVQGDRLLNAAGQLLAGMLRPTDLLGRLGGDEFVIFLVGIPDASLAVRRAEALCRAMREKLSLYGVGITASLGVALFPEDGANFHALYERADKSLYAVKAKGGNGCFREANEEKKASALARNEMASRIVVRTFGSFDVFVDQEPVSFPSAKAKELLAILVDRRGGILTSEEAVSLLWEDEPADKVVLSRYRKVALRLKNTLDAVGAGGILVSRRDGRCVDVNCLTCDYYRYLAGDEAARALYRGSYMSNYSWAESTLAHLEVDEA